MNISTLDIWGKIGYSPKVCHILASSIEDAWYQAMDAVINHGRKYKIDAGSYENDFRLTLPFVIEMRQPATRPLAPIIPEGSGIPAPTTDEQIHKYFESLISPEKASNQHYTYGEDLWYQVEEIVKYYKKHGHGTACGHMIVGRPESIFFYSRDVDLVEFVLISDRITGEPLIIRKITNLWNKNPKEEVSTQCLRSIDTWIEDGKLNFWVYFRSEEMYAAFPENYGGFQLLKEYMAESIGVEDGIIIASGKDIHLYKFSWAVALTRLKKEEKFLEKRFQEK
jgi:thymidylate synthase